DNGRTIEPLVVRPHEWGLHLLLLPKVSHLLDRLCFTSVAIYPGELAFDDVDRHHGAGGRGANEDATGVRGRRAGLAAGRVERDALFKTDELLLPLDLAVGRVQRNEIHRAADLGHYKQRVVDRQRSAKEEGAGKFSSSP